MKRVFLLAGLFLFVASVCTAQRLPELAVPDNYKLTFAPDFTKNNFTGDEIIQVRVLKPTSEIVLNAAEIDFEAVTITSGSTTQKAKVTVDKEKEMATLTVGNAIQPGSATIKIRYTGILNNELRGFYLGKDNDGRKYAATQLEATDARRAFPSFDEPAYKATFDVVVTADQGMTVISNTKAISDTPGPGRQTHGAFRNHAEDVILSGRNGRGELRIHRRFGRRYPDSRIHQSRQKGIGHIRPRCGREHHAVLQPLFRYQVSVRKARSGWARRLLGRRHGEHGLHHLPRRSSAG